MTTGDDFTRLATALGGALLAARHGQGLTQEQAAEACGLTAGYIARVERGERIPSPLVVDRLARAVGVEVADIWPRAVQTNEAKQVKTKAVAERDAAVARLVRATEDLSVSDVAQLTRTVQRLLRAGGRRAATRSTPKKPGVTS